MTTSQPKRGMHKDLRQFLRSIEKDGWGWHIRRNGHLRLDGPNGEVVFTGGTPTDNRAIKNLRSDMRRETKKRLETANS